MLACFIRSALMVNEDTPALYLPDATPVMMESNFADCHSVLRPSLAATALNRSTSKPWTVLSSEARNSLGAYVESVPIMIFPADLMDAGTFAASFESTLTDGVADALAPVVPLPHAD